MQSPKPPAGKSLNPSHPPVHKPGMVPGQEYGWCECPWCHGGYGPRHPNEMIVNGASSR